MAAATRHFAVPTAAITLDRTSRRPLYEQLYGALRAGIVEGRIPSGTQLPSSRSLADDLGVSRNTVMTVYEQLSSEGYITGRRGSGTFVASVVPDHAISSPPVTPPPRSDGPATDALSAFGQVARRHSAYTPFAGGWRPFMPGIADTQRFPAGIWRTLTARCWQEAPEALLGYPRRAGDPALRQAIAGYLGATRGIACTAEQVVIVGGTQQGLSLAARVLLEPGQKVWFENPGYSAARLALYAAGAQLVPVPVDGEGLCVPEGASLCPEASAVYVTPSNQFPLGSTMSARRRMALLDWASGCGAWILEDDYDSEFRYSSRPVAALQGLDSSGCVIYLGTFSKVMFPSLRLGYLIVPREVAATFAAAQAIDNGPVGTIEQAVLARFITEGHFARHVRRMRNLYAERQMAFLDLARAELGDLVTFSPAQAGIHLIAWLQQGVDDRRVAREAAARGIHVIPLSALSIGPAARPGLVVGYGGGDPNTMRRAMPSLQDAIRAAMSPA